VFSLPWQKKKAVDKEDEQQTTEKLDWFENFISREDKLPHPNWELIYQFVEENQGDQNPHQLWCNIARNWVDTLVQQLPHEYIKTETENFILITSDDQRYSKSLSMFLESCRRRLLAKAKGICSDDGYGKYVVIVFADIDSYYDYITYYGPQEGTYGLSSGMYLNYGYGHFVFRQEELDFAEAIAAHEMTHALLDHLPIPLWLNEGMAVNMESVITGLLPQRLNKSLFALHQNFWNHQTIQEFWRGDSFSRPDDGQKLSYQLAQILVTNLSRNYDAFTKYVNKANYADGGEAAIEEVYGLSLGDMIYNFLGEGDWFPKPRAWPKLD